MIKNSDRNALAWGERKEIMTQDPQGPEESKETLLSNVVASSHVNAGTPNKLHF